MSQGIWSDPQRDTKMLGRYHTGLAFRSGIFSAWWRSYLPFDVFRSLSHPLGLALGSPIFPSGCEGKLGVALESLQGLRDLT